MVDKGEGNVASVCGILNVDEKFFEFATSLCIGIRAGSTSLCFRIRVTAEAEIKCLSTQSTEICTKSLALAKTLELRGRDSDPQAHVMSSMIRYIW